MRAPTFFLTAALIAGLSACSTPTGSEPAPAATSAASPSTPAKAGQCPDVLPTAEASGAEAPAGKEFRPTAITICTYDDEGHQVATYEDAGPSAEDAEAGVTSYAEGTLERIEEGGTPGDACPAVMGPSWLVKLSAGDQSRYWALTASGCAFSVEVGPDFTTWVAGAKMRTMSDALLYDLQQQVPGGHRHDGHSEDHTH